MTPERENRITSVINNRQPDLTVVLENIEDRHNISAIMRTCDAVGVQELYVLNTIIGPHTEFGPRSSASAADWITVHQFDNVEACVEALRKKYKKIFATHLGEQAHSLYELDLAEPVALVFGNERKGVSAECLKHCDGNFIIPQVGMIRSLNVSVACAVSLYEAYRQRQVKGLYDGTCRLPEGQQQALTKSWGYWKKRIKEGKV
ncbi:TrmH family RNA methyltransferase [Polluticoccus soli]|uniref:TrmH family RNA methyltransferase n=1 Tax=Polluticoccus soli TaxID=3034150 RepID=UPI0023E18717|nr:TrmH family RNA methyltransferase [Flavipsychrobacter sp. JY13-12]